MGDNVVELIGCYGDDQAHALSAWTSTSRFLDEEKKARIPKLLKKLADDGHHTPFEKSSLHFLVTTDIASHIHIIKHRIAVCVNTESARYKELKEDKAYIPEDWSSIITSLDSLSQIPDSLKADSWKGVLENYTNIGNLLYHLSIKDVEKVLGRKRAKESCRFFKAYNSQITADVMFNFRSFMHFQKLRNSEHAQKEIREIAQKMLKLIQETGVFRYSLEAFGYGNN